MNTDGHIDAEEGRAYTGRAPGRARLTASERLTISDHIAQCPRCRELVSAHATGQIGSRRQILDEIQTLTTAARNEDAVEQEDMRVFARFVDSFPEERLAPGGTLPAATPARTAPAIFKRTSDRDGWWQALFTRSASFAAVSAVLALGAVLVTSQMFNREVASPGRVAAGSVPLLRDGPITVNADGSLAGDSALSDELRDALARIIREGSVHLSGATGLGTMRGESAGSAGEAISPAPVIPPLPIEPPMGSVIEEQQPLLRWTGVPGAAGYRIEIVSTAANTKISSDTLPPHETSWRVGTPLERGRIYRWKIQTLEADGRIGDGIISASLKILGATDESYLQALRSAPRISHLALAAAYSRFNLHRQTQQELQKLFEANPKSPLAAQLLESFQ